MQLRAESWMRRFCAVGHGEAFCRLPLFADEHQVENPVVAVDDYRSAGDHHSGVAPGQPRQLPFEHDRKTLNAFLEPRGKSSVPLEVPFEARRQIPSALDRKSTRLNSSHGYISYAVFCLKKKNTQGNRVIVLTAS